MKKIETISGIIFIVGIILKYLLIPGAGFLLTISGLVLASIYFYLGIFLFLDIKFKDWFRRESYQNIGPKRIFGAIITGVALSTVMVGIVFMFQYLPGWGIMIIVGGSPLIIILVISIIKFLQTKSNFYTGLIIRIALATILALLHLIFR
ncbi:MAG: hypothetical protein PHW83_01350 [Bacteroidales bacterium]|nr:hypothetical protein [Bacteroidales bacterium]